jgi:hypothetical protein
MVVVMKLRIVLWAGLLPWLLVLTSTPALAEESRRDEPAADSEVLYKGPVAAVVKFRTGRTWKCKLHQLTASGVSLTVRWQGYDGLLQYPAKILSIVAVEDDLFEVRDGKLVSLCKHFVFRAKEGKFVATERPQATSSRRWCPAMVRLEDGTVIPGKLGRKGRNVHLLLLSDDEELDLDDLKMILVPEGVYGMKNRSLVFTSLAEIRRKHEDKQFARTMLALGHLRDTLALYTRARELELALKELELPPSMRGGGNE